MKLRQARKILKKCEPIIESARRNLMAYNIDKWLLRAYTGDQYREAYRVASRRRRHKRVIIARDEYPTNHSDLERLITKIIREGIEHWSGEDLLK